MSSFSVSSSSNTSSSNTWSHQLSLAACSCSAYALAQLYSKLIGGWGGNNLGGREKVLSNLDLVSGLVHCTKTSAETVEDTAAA